MTITQTNIKQILVGISISLALALSGCGSDTTASSSANSLDTKSINLSASTRAATTVSPKDSTFVSKTDHSLTISFTMDENMSNENFDGFYLHATKLAYGATTLPDTIKDLEPKYAAIAQKSETFVADNGDLPDTHIMTIDHLDANTTYALFPASYENHDIDVDSGKRDLAVSDYIILTTDPAPLPDPYLNLAGWVNDNQQTFSRWSDRVYGAHATWCFAKDDNNESVFDGANLYRTRFVTGTDTLDESTLTKLDPTGLEGDEDDIFDTERDLIDCGLLEDYKYRYTLQAYNLVGEKKVYHDKNVTADIEMLNTNPERTCKTCTTTDSE